MVRLAYALISALVLIPAVAAERDLFRFKGFDYGTTDLPVELRQRLHEIELEHYQHLQQLIDAALIELYVEEEAQRRQLSKKDTIAMLFPLQPPEEQELQAFYQANQQRIQAPFEQVRTRLLNYLMGQQMQTRQAKLAAQLKADHPFELLVAKPEPPVVEIATEGFPSQGQTDAPVTVVEFADYQCPHCKYAAETIKRVLAQFTDQVRLVFMDQPINRSGISRHVAEGAVCAAQQDQFWAYHDLAFAQQQQLSTDSPLALAKTLGLDESQFSACLADPETKARVAQSKAEAQRLGVNRTPTFFINGKKLVTDDLESGLIEAIEAALAKAKS